jgi:hypothetical protein
VPFDKDGRHRIPESHSGRNERQREIQPGKANRKVEREFPKEIMVANQERLEAKIETNRKTDREERKAERKADLEEVKKMMEDMMRISHDKMDAWLAEKEGDQKDTTACQRATEANPEKLKTCQEATKAGYRED